MSGDDVERIAAGQTSGQRWLLDSLRMQDQRRLRTILERNPHDRLDDVIARRRGPNWKTLALTREDALHVYQRKSIDMVNYLRERRDPNGTLKAFFRKRHLAAARMRAALRGTAP